MLSGLNECVWAEIDLQHAVDQCAGTGSQFFSAGSARQLREIRISEERRYTVRSPGSEQMDLHVKSVIDQKTRPLSSFG